MNLGQECPVTRKKLGRKFANRRGFSRDFNVFKQISLIFRHPVNPENLEEGFKSEPTYVHIPVHKDVLSNGISEEEMTLLLEALATDKNFAIFKKSAPHAVLDGWTEDDLSSLV